MIQWTIVILVTILILTLIWTLLPATAISGGGGDRGDNKLKSKLEENGWVLYTMKGCHHCVRQKQVIDFPSTDVEDMSEDEKKMIKGFPTWFNVKTSELSPGFKSTTELSGWVA